MTRLFLAMVLATVSFQTRLLAAEIETYTQVVNPLAGAFDIKEVRIEKVDVQDVEFNSSFFRDYQNDCSSTPGVKELYASEITPKPVPKPAPKPIPSADPTGEFTLDQIINIGKSIWTFLQDNKPVVTTKTFYAHALPRGLQCWDDLENWQRPRSEVYRARYLNGFGFEVITLEFRLVYTYGGQVNSVGRYITNATIQFGRLDVSWGFKVNADVEVPLVVNVGSKASPVAGMQISVRWRASGLNQVERTASFFLYGDGRPTEVME